MPSTLLTICLITIIIPFVFSAPSPQHLKKRSFKISRYSNPEFISHDGPTQLRKSYIKFSLDVPDALENLVSTRVKARKHHHHQATTISNITITNGATNKTGTIAATPVPNDVEYISSIKIGGQNIHMDFDTGSSDLWVFNTQLQGDAARGHTLFDPTKSSTFRLLQGQSFSVSYGDGSEVVGNVGTDSVDIGGATVTAQAIGLATAVSSSFISDTASNGLVGLAFSKLNSIKPTQHKTFFDNALPLLLEPVFTADLRAAAVGAYEFGRIDASKFSGSLTWAPVITSNGFWEFSSTKFQVGDGTALTAPGGTAIADTGTTLMLVHNAVVNAYYSQVRGAVSNETLGGVVFPCDSLMPDLKVDIGGVYMATVPGRFINATMADPDSNTCFGGLQPTTSKLQIYGDILFKGQFVAFNGGNNSIGMAPHK